jgi:caffeoyl-CoA O-methyltransferase
MAEEPRARWMMGGITSEEVESYLYALAPPRDAVLAEMERVAAERKIPIVGPLVGRFFHQLAGALGAKRIFEMGSAIGYSTIWWARAVGEGGCVIYTDGDRRNAEQARRYFDRAGVAGRIEVRIGDALELLSEEKPESFDIVFNDVDKEDYPRVFRVAPRRVRRGGLFVSDNVLWHGRVAVAEADDAATRAIREFNRLLFASEELFTTIVPLRDGIALSTRL